MTDLDPSFDWKKLPDSETEKILTLQNQELVRIVLDEKNICVTKLDNEYFGINDRCPHAGTPFTLEKSCNKRGTVVCPTHHYKFNIKSGRSEDANHYKIPNYRFEQMGSSLYIGIKK